jgi:hypothetical protein
MGFIEKLGQPAVGSSPLQYPRMQHVWNYWSDWGGNYGNSAQLLHATPYQNSTPMLQLKAPASPVFGASAISGNTIAIGAPCAEFTSFADVGAISACYHFDPSIVCLSWEVPAARTLTVGRAVTSPTRAASTSPRRASSPAAPCARAAAWRATWPPTSRPHGRGPPGGAGDRRRGAQAAVGA